MLNKFDKQKALNILDRFGRMRAMSYIKDAEGCTIVQARAALRQITEDRVKK